MKLEKLTCKHHWQLKEDHKSLPGDLEKIFDIVIMQNSLNWSCGNWAWKNTKNSRETKENGLPFETPSTLALLKCKLFNKTSGLYSSQIFFLEQSPCNCLEESSRIHFVPLSNRYYKPEMWVHAGEVRLGQILWKKRKVWHDDPASR